MSPQLVKCVSIPTGYLSDEIPYESAIGEMRFHSHWVSRRLYNGDIVIPKSVKFPFPLGISQTKIVNIKPARNGKFPFPLGISQTNILRTSKSKPLRKFPFPLGISQTGLRNAIEDIKKKFPFPLGISQTISIPSPISLPSGFHSHWVSRRRILKVG